MKKKAAVGVRGIRLQKKDELEHIYLFEEGTETKIDYNEKEVTLNRLKQATNATAQEPNIGDSCKSLIESWLNLFDFSPCNLRKLVVYLPIVT